MQIAYHQIIEAWRSNARVGNNHGAELFVDDFATIVEDMDQFEMALTRLRDIPERQQTVVTLRFLWELLAAVVANVLEILEEGVRAAAMRGIRSLRSGIPVLAQRG